jgi:hypothetical protein
VRVQIALQICTLPLLPATFQIRNNSCHVHRLADVLDALETVYADVNDPRESRQYRLKFPPDVKGELKGNLWGMYAQHTLGNERRRQQVGEHFLFRCNAETLLFAAELIADGRVLEGKEDETEALKPAALELCDAFETCNRVLRAQVRCSSCVVRPAAWYNILIRTCRIAGQARPDTVPTQGAGNTAPL